MQRQTISAALRHPKRFVLPLGAALCCGMFPGCTQKMAEQPAYRPLEPSRFFADGRAARPLVAGVVVHDDEVDDGSMTSGRKAVASSTEPSVNMAAAQGIRPDEFVTEFPFAITSDILARGRERYTIYCAICHDNSGTGNGKIVQRGFTKPPSYLTDNSRQFAHSGLQIPLREVPVGYLFDVPTNGFGAMADYSTQVAPRDRWAIAAYIRTLQLSQSVPLDDLPLALRDEAQHALEATP
ncbi:MAG TPA: cytochrome c [Lacipirellulaceae bacterium]|nr:cytochrome c [Lacipirellulaceae bacterium]